MLDKTGSIMQALVTLVEVYGKEYIKAHKNAPYFYSENDGKCTISFLFETADDRPDLVADSLGWAVCATVIVDPRTAKANLLEATLPDGKKLNKNVSSKKGI